VPPNATKAPVIRLIKYLVLKFLIFRKELTRLNVVLFHPSIGSFSILHFGGFLAYAFHILKYEQIYDVREGIGLLRTPPPAEGSQQHILLIFKEHLLYFQIGMLLNFRQNLMLFPMKRGHLL
jgi:hypothetical protein